MVSIGIDFGTTYSRVAVYHEGRIDVIRNDFGSILTDSYVAFSKDGFLVGDEAKSQLTLNPTNTIFNMKRLVGRTSNDFMFQEDLKRLPYTVNQSYLKPKIKVMYKNKEKILIPEQVIAMILLKMKMIAEQYLNTLVKSAVISVPAYFNQLQRQAIIDAASIANLDIILINEPTAVAINYSLENNIEKAQNIMVFDLGGGKLDVSILTLFQEMITVKATVGDTNLGGEDFDNNMVDYFIERLPIDQKNSVLKDKRALQRMRIACEKAKRKLSTEKRVIVEIEPLFKKKYFFSPITQQEFETINADLFLKIMEIVKEAIRDSKINKYQIHEVIIVGGSSRIPKIQQLLQNLFNGKMLNKSLNLDLSTVIGAAMRSAMLNRNTQHLIPKLIIMDVMPFYVAIDRPNSIVTLIKKNSKIPTNYTFRLPYEISNLSDTNIITLKILNKRKTVRVDEQFILSGIPQVAHHIENPKFEITLRIDENGIISMNAIEEWTKFDKIIMADNKRFLTDNQINRMSRVTMQYLNNSDMEIEEEVENNNGMVWAFKRKLSNSNHRNSIKKLFTKENDEEIRESGRRMKMCNIL